MGVAKAVLEHSGAPGLCLRIFFAWMKTRFLDYCFIRAIHGGIVVVCVMLFTPLTHAVGGVEGAGLKNGITPHLELSERSRTIRFIGD